MRLKSTSISEFKRFHHLQVTSLSETARLIVLAGSNGQGKSSFFDALRVWLGAYGQRGFARDTIYYDRRPSVGALAFAESRVNVEFHTPLSRGSPEAQRALYFRSAYRNTPEIAVPHLQKLGPAQHESRLAKMNENDLAVSQNYARYVSNAFDIGFSNTNDLMSIGEWRNSVMSDLSGSITRLFPNLKLESLGNPLVDPTFRFEKGVSKSFDFRNLSGGEKAAFDLILDICAKRSDFFDSVYCIDEPELHINPRLHGDLLDTLLYCVPKQGQLIVATHSLGIMRRARDMNVEQDGHTIFLDFDGHDFDDNVVLQPQTPNRAFWDRAFEVALGDMAALVAPRVLIVCEGVSTNEQRDVGFDARVYNAVFSEEYPDIKFVSGGSASEVESDRRGFADAMPSVVAGTKVLRLVDRDDRNEEDVRTLNKKGVLVLKSRNIEAFLWSKELLEMFCLQQNRPDVIEDLDSIIQSALNDSVRRLNPQDDFKSVSGAIYNDIKKRLALPAAGKTSSSFALQYLLPLIKPGTIVYQKMKTEIMEPVNSTKDSFTIGRRL